MKEKQEYFITKISDRKDNYYQYYRTLEVDETFLDSLTNLPDLNITNRVKQLIEAK